MLCRKDQRHQWQLSAGFRAARTLKVWSPGFAVAFVEPALVGCHVWAQNRAKDQCADVTGDFTSREPCCKCSCVRSGLNIGVAI